MVGWWMGVALAAWPELGTGALETGGGSADAALVVSIEDYAFVGDVSGAQRNGRDWYQWLTDTRGVPAAQVRLLEDAQATREEVLTAAQELSGAMDPAGKLWVVFVGHGAPAPSGDDGLLLGVDVQQTARSVTSRGVRQSELLEATRGGHHTVLVLDACFSGMGSDGAALVPGLQPLVPTYSLPDGGATVLSAGRSDEFAGPLPGGDRPAFSYLALGALQGWGDADDDGVVTASEVADYARGALQSTLVGRTQQPTLAGVDAPLAAGTQEGPNLAALRLGGGTVATAPSPLLTETASVPLPTPATRPAPTPSRPSRTDGEPPRGAMIAALAWDTCAIAALAGTATLAGREAIGSVGSGLVALGCSAGGMIKGQQAMSRARGARRVDPVGIAAWTGLGVSGLFGINAALAAGANDADATSLASAVTASVATVSAVVLTADALGSGGTRGQARKRTLRLGPTGVSGTF